MKPTFSKRRDLLCANLCAASQVATKGIEPTVLTNAPGLGGEKPSEADSGDQMLYPGGLRSVSPKGPKACMLYENV